MPSICGNGKGKANFKLYINKKINTFSNKQKFKLDGKLNGKINDYLNEDKVK